MDLARGGVRALVVEKGGALFLGSRGTGIQPRAREVLDDLASARPAAPTRAARPTGTG